MQDMTKIVQPGMLCLHIPHRALRLCAHVCMRVFAFSLLCVVVFAPVACILICVLLCSACVFTAVVVVVGVGVVDSAVVVAAVVVVYISVHTGATAPSGDVGRQGVLAV